MSANIDLNVLYVHSSKKIPLVAFLLFTRAYYLYERWKRGSNPSPTFLLLLCPNAFSDLHCASQPNDLKPEIERDTIEWHLNMFSISHELLCFHALTFAKPTKAVNFTV